VAALTILVICGLLLTQTCGLLAGNLSFEKPCLKFPQSQHFGDLPLGWGRLAACGGLVGRQRALFHTPLWPNARGNSLARVAPVLCLQAGLLALFAAAYRYPSGPRHRV